MTFLAVFDTTNEREVSNMNPQPSSNISATPQPKTPGRRRDIPAFACGSESGVTFHMPKFDEQGIYVNRPDCTEARSTTFFREMVNAADSMGRVSFKKLRQSERFKDWPANAVDFAYLSCKKGGLITKDDKGTLHLTQLEGRLMAVVILKHPEVKFDADKPVPVEKRPFPRAEKTILRAGGLPEWHTLFRPSAKRSA